MAVAFGALMVVVGGWLAARSLSIVHRAVRVWPHPITSRSAEQFLPYEFLVRFVGLMMAAAGAALILITVL